MTPFAVLLHDIPCVVLTLLIIPVMRLAVEYRIIGDTSRGHDGAARPALTKAARMWRNTGNTVLPITSGRLGQHPCWMDQREWSVWGHKGECYKTCNIIPGPKFHALQIDIILSIGDGPIRTKNRWHWLPQGVVKTPPLWGINWAPHILGTWGSFCAG